MYHGFDFSDGVGIGIQQTVDYGQFILGLRAQPYPNYVTVDGFFFFSYFYVAFQIIGEYLFFINSYLPISYTIPREYDEFGLSRKGLPITPVTGTD